MYNNAFSMEKKIVDEEFNVSKPVALARSEKDVPVGEYDYFKSDGWYIRARVNELVVAKTDLYQGFNIYRVADIEYIRYFGLEMTDKEKKDLDNLKRKGRAEYTPPYLKD